MAYCIPTACSKETIPIYYVRCNRLHLSNKGDGSSKLLMNHKSKDSKLGGTSIVKLNGSLLQLGLLIEGVPSKVEGSITEVTDEFTLSGNILHDKELEEANEGNDLEKTGFGHGSNSGPSIRD
mmetsp:Transcript_11532/g.16695  ORF Transcript_11532/g.16695 Transcript_11532/m.16695 type:complete len:123 (+) Transcript_11532:93-461(+)